MTSNETCGDMEREGMGEGCGSEGDRWGPRMVSTHSTHGQQGSAAALTFGFSCSFHDWNTRNVCEELACKSETTEMCRHKRNKFNTVRILRKTCTQARGARFNRLRRLIDCLPRIESQL